MSLSGFSSSSPVLDSGGTMPAAGSRVCVTSVVFDIPPSRRVAFRVSNNSTLPSLLLSLRPSPLTVFISPLSRSPAPIVFNSYGSCGCLSALLEFKLEKPFAFAECGFVPPP